MFLDYLPSLIIGLVSLSLIFYLLKKERNTSSQDRDTIISLEKKLAARNQEITNLNEKIKENDISKEKEKEVLTKEFENLANKILDQLAISKNMRMYKNYNDELISGTKLYKPEGVFPRLEIKEKL